mgnify:FL=1
MEHVASHAHRTQATSIARLLSLTAPTHVLLVPHPVPVSLYAHCNVVYAHPLTHSLTGCRSPGPICAQQQVLHGSHPPCTTTHWEALAAGTEHQAGAASIVQQRRGANGCGNSGGNSGGSTGGSSSSSSSLQQLLVASSRAVTRAIWLYLGPLPETPWAAVSAGRGWVCAAVATHRPTGRSSCSDGCVSEWLHCWMQKCSSASCSRRDGCAGGQMRMCRVNLTKC